MGVAAIGLARLRYACGIPLVLIGLRIFSAACMAQPRFQALAIRPRLLVTAPRWAPRLCSGASPVTILVSTYGVASSTMGSISWTTSWSAACGGRLT